VVRLQARFGVSERRAVGVWANTGPPSVTAGSTCPTRPTTGPDALARRHPRHGYRRIHVLLTREGWACNRKRVQRLWRDDGLQVPRRPRRRKKTPRTPGSAAAAHPDHINDQSNEV